MSVLRVCPLFIQCKTPRLNGCFRARDAYVFLGAFVRQGVILAASGHLGLRGPVCRAVQLLFERRQGNQLAHPGTVGARALHVSRCFMTSPAGLVPAIYTNCRPAPPPYCHRLFMSGVRNAMCRSATSHTLCTFALWLP